MYNHPCTNGFVLQATATGLMRDRSWVSFYNLYAADIKLGLQVEPELGAGTKEYPEDEDGFSIDGTLTLDDFVDGGAGGCRCDRRVRLELG